MHPSFKALYFNIQQVYGKTTFLNQIENKKFSNLQFRLVHHVRIFPVPIRSICTVTLFKKEVNRFLINLENESMFFCFNLILLTKYYLFCIHRLIFKDQNGYQTSNKTHETSRQYQLCQTFCLLKGTK